VAPVEITTNPTVAAARPRALSPSTLIADWNTQRPTTGMRDQSAVVSLGANHNSITRSLPVAGFGYGAAKQGAPPRGVPR
jgi:hypothetical protein